MITVRNTCMRIPLLKNVRHVILDVMNARVVLLQVVLCATQLTIESLLMEPVNAKAGITLIPQEPQSAWLAAASWQIVAPASNHFSAYFPVPHVLSVLYGQEVHVCFVPLRTVFLILTLQELVHALNAAPGLFWMVWVVVTYAAPTWQIVFNALRSLFAPYVTI